MSARRWLVAQVLTDSDPSASRFATKNRSDYARVRDLLQPGDVLVTWEASRAQRDLARYVELRDLCANAARVSYSSRLFELTDNDGRFATGLDPLLAAKGFSRNWGLAGRDRRSLPDEHQLNEGRLVEWPPTKWSKGRDRGVVFARTAQTKVRGCR